MIFRIKYAIPGACTISVSILSTNQSKPSYILISHFLYCLHSFQYSMELVAYNLLTVVQQIKDTALLSALDSLQSLTHIQLEQPFELLDPQKKFIFHTNGQILFYGAEQAEFRANSRGRAFHIKILSPLLLDEVLNVHRKKGVNYLPCFGTEHMKITSPMGQNFGFIDQVSKNWSCFLDLNIQDSDGKKLLSIRDISKGKTMFNCFRMKDFQILDLQKKVVGTIVEEDYSNSAYIYHITFLSELDVKEKALVMAATLMMVRICFLYCELLFIQCFTVSSL